MTIHRAKGLEFDHVFVPALERTTRAPERRLLRWIDLPGESEDSELLIAPAPIVGEEEGALNAYLKDLLREREANERKRLLYVAATRARRTLWLSAAPRTDAEEAVRPDRRSLLAALWPALAPRFESVPMDAPTPALVSGASVLRRLVAAWRPPPLPRPRRSRICPRRIWPPNRWSSAGWARRSGTSARWCTRGSRAWGRSKPCPRSR